ncbi:MAG: hypothetical protein EU529_04740 [Promethearchaeota archaeon]|nr:MAG: hypothetical protein EU529_04740 [Candidatus Lokiarchaeota archaeon]
MTSIIKLKWGIVEIIYLVIIFAIGFLITLLITPYIIKYMKKKGNVGYDIHKNARPEVAESGGISLIVGIFAAAILSIILFPIFFNVILIFIITIGLAAVIGLIDDIKKLRSRWKIALTIFTGSALFFANLFNFIKISSPVLPFLGKTRLTLIYPLLVPIIVAVFANTTNMMEGYNAEGSGTCLIAACFLFICALIWDSFEAVLFTIIAIAVLIPFFIYNRYPAKVFPGDIGTLSMGVMIACIALFGSLEVVIFCLLLMHIFNSFILLSSVRGFLESSKIQNSMDDIILLEDDRIKASDQQNAALTLPRLILAKGPLTEKELVLNFFIISIICGFFSIITLLIIAWTHRNLDFMFVIITGIILLIPTMYFLYKFNRIRGIIFLMVGLLVGGASFLIFVDIYIMHLPFSDIDLIFIIIPIKELIAFVLFIPGLVLFYFITIKYFWFQINKGKKIETKKSV